MFELSHPTDAGRLQRAGRRSQVFLLSVLGILVFRNAFETLIHPRTLQWHPALIVRHLNPANLDLAARVAAFVILSVPTIPILWAVWQAVQLSRSMAGSSLFTDELPMRLRRMGIALIAAAVLDPLSGGVLSRLLTDIVQGAPSVAIIITIEDFGLAVVGAALMAVAGVAREAVRLADENARFI